MTQVQRVYSKPCRYCGKLAIFWSDIHKYFCDTPDGPKHNCPSSSTKHRQEDMDKRINGMLNDLKSEISSKISAVQERMDLLQKVEAKNGSILQEIRMKINEALRETP